MRILIKHELKHNFKSFIIWSLAVGIMGFLCISLYTNMSDNMASLAESFSEMGAFSDAFGMSTLSIGTIAGYFAVEVGTIHSLGGSMFMAVTATTILSKEEDGHTGEFMFSLPVSRTRVITSKLVSLLMLTTGFTVVTGLFYVFGFAVIGTSPDTADFIRFMLSQMMLDIEIMLICAAFSACVKRNLIGAGLGIALLLYLFDIAGRVIPDLKDMIFVGPFSYANASTIFAKEGIGAQAYITGIVLMAAAGVLTYMKYTKKDLAS